MSPKSNFPAVQRRVFEENGMHADCIGCAHVQLRQGVKAFECEVFYDPCQACQRPGGCRARTDQKEVIF